MAGLKCSEEVSSNPLTVSLQNTQANRPDHPRAEEDRLQRRPDDDPGKPGAHLHQFDGHAGDPQIFLTAITIDFTKEHFCISK